MNIDNMQFHMRAHGNRMDDHACVLRWHYWHTYKHVLLLVGVLFSFCKAWISYTPPTKATTGSTRIRLTIKCVENSKASPRAAHMTNYQLAEAQIGQRSQLATSQESTPFTT